MVECIRYHIALCFLLKIIVADYRRGGYRLFKVALFKRLKEPVFMIAPYSGKKIGLQFNPYTCFIGLFFALSGHSRVSLVKGAEQLLFMVAHFLCYAITIGDGSGSDVSLVPTLEKRSVGV